MSGVLDALITALDEAIGELDPKKGLGYRKLVDTLLDAMREIADQI